MKQLFLVRHGTTVQTQERRYSGVSDVGLAELGVRQVRLVGEFFRSKEFGLIYSSPLKRCVATAGAISTASDVCVESLAGLGEINFGLWEGLTFEEIQKAYPEQLKCWCENPNAFTFPKGESVCEFYKRVLGAMEIILAGTGDVVVVAHGGSLRVMICNLCGWPTESLHSFELAPASVTVLKCYERSTVVSVLNDTCHLSDGGMA